MNETNAPLVTIGIPTYNRADGNLPLAIDCALAQTYPNLEVVVSDNCSTDHTPALLSQVTDPRFRYVRQETNLGANGNFNACLQTAKGDYFLLFHDDDLVDPDFVSTCMEAANYSTQYGFIRTGTRIINGEGKVTQEAPNQVASSEPVDFYFAWLQGQTSLYLCSTLFNTEKLKEMGGFRSKHNLLEDGVAVVKLSEKYPHLDIYDIKASFRMHEEQRTFAVTVSEWCEEFVELIAMMCAQVPDRKGEIYDLGSRFFAKICLNHAKAIPSRVKRTLALLDLARNFKPKYWLKHLNRRFWR